jgi:hypothetical protein
LESERNLVDLGEVVREDLLHAALLLRLLLELIEVLQQQVTQRLCGFELEWQHSMRGEDPQEHLHALLDLLDPAEAFIHSSTHPHWNQLTLLTMTLPNQASQGTVCSLKTWKVNRRTRPHSKP